MHDVAHLQFASTLTAPRTGPLAGQWRLGTAFARLGGFPRDVSQEAGKVHSRLAREKPMLGEQLHGPLPKFARLMRIREGLDGVHHEARADACLEQSRLRLRRRGHTARAALHKRLLHLLLALVGREACLHDLNAEVFALLPKLSAALRCGIDILQPRTEERIATAEDQALGTLSLFPPHPPPTGMQQCAPD